MILSLDDPRVKDLKYEKGDKFLLNQDALKNPKWEEDMVEDLQGRTVVVEVESYELDMDGEIGYKCSMISGPDNFFPWFIPPEMLDSDFIYLGKDHKNLRFALLDQ